MEPRHPILAAAAIVLLVAVGPSRAQPTGEAPPAAENVLFVMGDDHATHAFGAYGNEQIRTPNLDRLAAEGMRFDRAYVNAPVCTPSRQSILTGRLPHAAGVTLLRTALPDSQRTIAEHLGDRGFATGAIGKMHFNGSGPHGFEVRVDRADYRRHLEEHPPRRPPDTLEVRPPWRPFSDPARVWLNSEGRPSSRYLEDSEGTYLARRAIDFLRENRYGRFCLWLSFHEPHSPFNFPVEFAERHDPSEIELPRVGPEDRRWIPREFRDLRPPEMRGIVASYYTSVEYLDHNVGRVLDALDRLGLDENTLVIYVGDHGYLLGHHGRFEKHMMWEEAVRAPLIARGPGIRSSDTDALVEFVDLVPTVLDVLREPPMEGVQGRSLLPLVEGATDEHRRYVFSEFLADEKAMVRTDRFKYVFTTGSHDLAQNYETGFGPSGIDHRLYDLRRDPGEQNDLAGDPQYAGRLARMQLLMLERFRRSHPRAEKLPPQLSLEESLVWFTRPPERTGPFASD